MDDGIKFTKAQQLQWDDNCIKLMEIHKKYTGKNLGINVHKKRLEWDLSHQ